MVRITQAVAVLACYSHTVDGVRVSVRTAQHLGNDAGTIAMFQNIATAGGYLEATGSVHVDKNGDCPFPNALKGRYTGEIMVGTGATACVFIAHDQTGHNVAIKVAKQASFMSMWEGECGQMQQIRLKSCWAGQDKLRLAEQYLPTCVELGGEGEFPWYVMHAAGRLGVEEAGGRFSEADAKNIFSQMVGGIYALHSLDFSHNDLHGKNIVIDGTQLAVIDFGEIRPLPQAQRGPGLKRDANAIWTFGALLSGCQCRGPACQGDEKDSTLRCMQEKWNVDGASLSALTQLIDASVANDQEQQVEGVFLSNLVQGNLPAFVNEYPWEDTDGCESWNWEDGSHPRPWESTECLDVAGMPGKCPIGLFPGACFKTTHEPWMCWAEGQDFTNTFCQSNGFEGACKYADYGRQIPEDRLDSCEEMGECGLCGGHDKYVGCYVNDKTGIPPAAQCVCANHQLADALHLLSHGCKTYKIGVRGDRAFDGVCKFTGAAAASLPPPAQHHSSPHAPPAPAHHASPHAPPAPAHHSSPHAPPAPAPVVEVTRPSAPAPSSEALSMFTLHKDSRCGGPPISYWKSDHSITFYGDSFQDDLPGCAAMCQAHEDCAGFVQKSNGKCSYWKSAPFHIRAKHGYNCYAK